MILDFNFRIDLRINNLPYNIYKPCKFRNIAGLKRNNQKQMFKYTKHSLKKLETIFKEQEYTIRYEKGSFNSGYCMVEHRNIAVINKFFDTEGRINVLLEILGTIDIKEDSLSESSLKFYKILGKLTKSDEEE